MAEKETPEFVENEDIDLIDEASSADTLRPGAGSGGGDTKAETLATFTQLLSQLGKEDLSKIFNDVQSQFGANKVPGGEDKSASNRATVDMKPSAAVGKSAWKEDIDAMFSEDELSEEFREKAETIFEAVVNAKMNVETVRIEEEFTARAEALEEQFNQDLEEATSNIVEDLSSKLDQYLDYVVEQWIEENKLAVESSIRSDIAEGFMKGLQNLFTEHYIDVPEDKVDVFAEMKSEIEDLRTKLNETLDQKIELEQLIDEATKEATLDEICEGMVVTQAEKLRALAEGIEFNDAETYAKKIGLIKESCLTEKKNVGTGLITEEIDGTDNSVNEEVVPASMAKYVDTISKIVK